MNYNVVQYQLKIMEHIVKVTDFTTKEEVIEMAKLMNDVAQKHEEYSADLKTAFKEAITALEQLNLNDIKSLKKFSTL